MERSESIGSIALALAKAQGEFTIAERDAENPYYGHNYSTMAAVVTACRKALAANEISVLQSTENEDDQIVVITMLCHSSGEWFRSVLKVRPQMQVVDSGRRGEGNGGPKEKAITAQSVGAASTYCCRYALRSLLVIATEEDDDGNAASGKNEKVQAEQAGRFVDVVTDIISESKPKKGGGTFTIHKVVTGEHGTYQTFDRKLIDAIAPHKGTGVAIEIDTVKNEKGYGFDIVGFAIVHAKAEAQPEKKPDPQPEQKKAEPASGEKPDIRALLGGKAELVERYFRVTGHLPKDGTLYTLKPNQETQLRHNPDGAIAAAEKWAESLKLKSTMPVDESKPHNEPVPVEA